MPDSIAFTCLDCRRTVRGAKFVGKSGRCKKCYPAWRARQREQEKARKARKRARPYDPTDGREEMHLERSRELSAFLRGR